MNAGSSEERAGFRNNNPRGKTLTMDVEFQEMAFPIKILEQQQQTQQVMQGLMSALRLP